MMLQKKSLLGFHRVAFFGANAAHIKVVIFS